MIAPAPNEVVFPSDIAFTPAVKAIQARKGSRGAYERMENGEGWQTTITDDLAAFIATQTSFLLATANRETQPYAQHRGGPPGFLHVIDDRTLGFADFRGNRQYITLGNLSQNPKAFLFLIDYTHRQRVKIWGEARLAEDPELIARLMPENYKARPEQAILFTVATWSGNCQQHIPQRFDAADVADAIAAREQRIAELEAEVARLREARAG
jgi:predicted pyridoxine 5'-phosphate oxidase superfamily flavin-nucleotide-binding protein